MLWNVLGFFKWNLLTYILQEKNIARSYLQITEFWIFQSENPFNCIIYHLDLHQIFDNFVVVFKPCVKQCKKTATRPVKFVEENFKKFKNGITWVTDVKNDQSVLWTAEGNALTAVQRRFRKKYQNWAPLRSGLRRLYEDYQPWGGHSHMCGSGFPVISEE